MSDDLMKHEALDRCHVLLATLDDHLLGHPFVQGNPHILHAVQSASESLATVYQLIGGAGELDLPPMPSAEGWIPWAGGECPLKRGTIHQVRFRDGFESDPDGCPQGWHWRHDGNPADIIAYRVVGEPK